MKIIIFDLFNTLLECDEQFKLILVDKLHNIYFNKTKNSDLINLYKEYERDYLDKREERQTEYTFYHQINFYQEKLNTVVNEDLEKVEEIIFNNLADYKLKPNVKDALKYFKENKYKIGLISNTIFSLNQIKKVLKKLEIIDFFDVINTSSNSLIRKPNKKIFEDTMKMFNTNNNDIEFIYFVGDDYEKDYKGALNMGYRAIYFSEKEKNSNDLRIENFNSLIEYFKQNIEKAAK